MLKPLFLTLLCAGLIFSCDKKNSSPRIGGIAAKGGADKTAAEKAAEEKKKAELLEKQRLENEERTRRRTEDVDISNVPTTGNSEANSVPHVMDPNLGYIVAQLNTEKDNIRYQKARLDLSADSTNETSIGVICYEGNAEKIKDLNAAGLYLFPVSEVLIEAQSSGSTDTNKKSEYMINHCQGDAKVFDKAKFEADAKKRYEVVSLKDGEKRKDYFRYESTAEKAIVLTVQCVKDFKAKAEMKLLKSTDGKEALNRVTLREGSRMVFDRPMKFKKDGKTLEEGKMRPLVVITCD